MLAHAEGLDLLGVNVDDAREDAAQTHGVERGAGAKDVLARQAEVAVQVLGHDVGGVGDAEHDAVEAGVAHGAHDALEHLHGAAEHVEASLARPAAAARGEDDEVGVRAVGVVANVDVERVAHAGGEVLEVHDLGLSGLAVDVEKHDLVYQVAEHQAQRDVAANATSADDDHLAGLVWLLNGHCFLLDERTTTVQLLTKGK